MSNGSPYKNASQKKLHSTTRDTNLFEKIFQIQTIGAQKPTFQVRPVIINRKIIQILQKSVV